MKKTFNINLGGQSFTVDEDAYDLLNDYLDTLEHVFGIEGEGADIVADIETRISEIFMLELLPPRTIVTLKMVEEVIARIGKPDEIADETDETIVESETPSEEKKIEEEVKETRTELPPPYNPPLPPLKRKLFRDPQNAMIGGVCSGIGHYIGLDATWVRLIMVVLCFVSFSTFLIVYIILWIVVPEAVTPIQRMQMLGEYPTIQNIGKNVTDTFREDNTAFRQDIFAPPTPATPGKRLIDSFLKVCGFMAKVLMILVLIIALPVLLGLGVALVACIIALFAVGIAFFFAPAEALSQMSVIQDLTSIGNDPFMPLLLIISAIFAVAIPLFLLIRLIWPGDKNKFRPMAASTRITLAVIWIVSIILSGVFVVLLQ